jgi:hypothetical protein
MYRILRDATYRESDGRIAGDCDRYGYYSGDKYGRPNRRCLGDRRAFGFYRGWGNNAARQPVNVVA